MSFLKQEAVEKRKKSLRLREEKKHVSPSTPNPDFCSSPVVMGRSLKWENGNSEGTKLCLDDSPKDSSSFKSGQRTLIQMQGAISLPLCCIFLL